MDHFSKPRALIFLQQRLKTISSRAETTTFNEFFWDANDGGEAAA